MGRRRQHRWSQLDALRIGGRSRSPDTGVADTTCATVNTGTINPSWDNENKRGGANVRIAEFYEGGINITEAGVTGECFATFLGNTRSSQELGATLFDYALGQLGECDVTVATSPSVSTIQLGAGTVTDTAAVTGTGGVGTPPVPTGTVAFFVCQPTELDANGECSAGGTQVGTPDEGEDLFATTNPSQSAATSERGRGITPCPFSFVRGLLGQRESFPRLFLDRRQAGDYDKGYKMGIV